MLSQTVLAQDGEVSLSLEKAGGGAQGDFVASEIISGDEIANKNTPAMLDLISNVPGVFVTKAASGIKSDLNIRGLGDSFRRIGLFVDGRPEKVSLYGCGVSQTMLVGNIAEIEVIKTPDSVLYGGDGFGGLINILTHEPQDIIEGQIGFSYGTFNTQNYSAYLGGQSEKVIYEVSVNNASSDGYLENSGYNATDTYIKLGYKIDDTSEIKITRKDFSGIEYEPIAKDVSGSTRSAASYDFKRNATDIRYEKRFENTKIDILAFADSGEHKFSDSFHSKDILYGITARMESKLFEGNTLKYGIEYKYSEAEVLNAAAPPALMPRGTWKKGEAALFALDEYEVISGLKLFAGARYNYDEISGEVFVPRAGAVYNITEKIALRGGYSKGFRSPYINELYTVPPRNPDLKPETQDSFEAGINSKYFGIDFDAAAFIIKGDNYIQEVFISPMHTPVPVQFHNSGSYEFKGAEFSLRGEILKKLNGFAAYSYLDAGDLKEGVSKNKITQPVAKNKVDLSLDYKIGKFGFHVNALLVFDYYAIYASNTNSANIVKLDDFNVFNAKVHFNVNEQFSIYVAADNFTNQKYEMYIVSFGADRIYEMPGATATIGAVYKF
jgi:outer membrane receptor protein involved in Fe transport